MKNKKLILYFIIAVFFLLLSGCGASDNTSFSSRENQSLLPTDVPLIEIANTVSTPAEFSFSISGPSPTPSPTPTPVPTHTPVPTPRGLLGARYDGFCYNGEELDEYSYRSENISIQVYSQTDRNTYDDYIAFYVADIHLQNIEDLKTACAGSSFYSMESAFPLKIGKRHDALFACTGDYYVDNKGLLIRNGVLYKNYKGKYDICVLLKDGTVEIFSPDEYETADIIAMDPWQVWSFGPSLLKSDGSAKSNWGNSQIDSRNPRCIFGYYEPGHYSLVVIDGRQSRYSMGLTLSDLSRFCVNMGYTKAYNLDGGKTASMCWQGKVFNKPESGGRSVSDIIYISREG